MEETNQRFAKIENLMTTLTQSIEGLRQEKEKRPLEEAAEDGRAPVVPYIQNPVQPLKQVKVDFPRFDVTEPLYWLFRAEQYFKFYDTTKPQN